MIHIRVEYILSILIFSVLSFISLKIELRLKINKYINISNIHMSKLKGAKVALMLWLLCITGNLLGCRIICKM